MSDIICVIIFFTTFPRYFSLRWTCRLLGLFLDPEDGGDMFLRNISLSWNYTMLQPRILYCSKRPMHFSSPPCMSYLFTLISTLLQALSYTAIFLFASKNTLLCLVYNECNTSECNPLKVHWRKGGAYCLELQNRKISRERNKEKYTTDSVKYL
jgi:hypothetical protein